MGRAGAGGGGGGHSGGGHSSGRSSGGHRVSSGSSGRRQPRQLRQLWRTIEWRRILRWWVLSTAADTEYRFYRSWRRG